jgi:pyridinium-3,5-biscarboxylic acid mononucleotide synthase
MDSQQIRNLLTELQQGNLSVEDALAKIGTGSEKTVRTEAAQVDIDRKKRCGFPEVIYAEGKTSQAIIEIIEILNTRKENILATRVSPEQAEQVCKKYPSAIHNQTARTIRIENQAEEKKQGTVAVITAGTSDLPIAEEAIETLKWMHCEVKTICDVGVAGPHRLGEHLDLIQNCDAVVVIAGMEGALPSVVGGWVDSPVIAVPTSVGYGASFGGVSALLGMLNSCASNVTVVNIDSGFKGGYVAGLIAKRSNR